MNKYNWGILSTAKIGRRAMIPALKESKFAQVAAIASRNSEKAKNFAIECNIPVSYGNYNTLLNDPSIDIIYNPLPNHLHKAWTIRAAEAGKHILCEKPLALNPEECLEMIAAARTNGVQLMESFMYRHHPRIKAAREMIQNGAIGEVKTIESAFTFSLQNANDFRYNPEMGGGSLMDVGCYCINISRLITGREPEWVQARAVWAPSGVDDQLTAILDFGDGVLAHFDSGFNQSTRQRCIVAGTDGFLAIRDAFLPGKGKTVIYEVRPGTSRDHKFSGVDEYRLIAEDFMCSLESGIMPFPPDDAVANMRVIQALLHSARHDGKPVNL